MGLERMEVGGLLGIVAFLWCGNTFALALAARRCLAALRDADGLWRFRALRLDGDRGHNPSGVFAVVATRELLTLHARSLGLRVFKQLPLWPFDRLASVSIAGCLFEAGGAEALAGLLRGHRIRRLELHSCFLSPRDLELLAAATTSLRHLAISEAGQKVALGAELCSLLSACAIESLSLSGGFELGGDCLDALGGHASLRSLCLSANPFLRDDALRRLLARVRDGAADGAASLTELDVSAPGGGSLTDTAGAAIAEALAAGVGLRDLRLVGHEMTQGTLASVLLHGVRLRTLDLSSNNLGDVASIGAVVAPLQELRVGDVAGLGGFLERRPLGALAWAAPCLGTLRSLDASGAGLDDDALLDLAARCETRPAQLALESLDLSWNDISEDGLEALLGLLRRGGARLQRLEVGVNQVGDSGCRAIGLEMRPGGALHGLRRLGVRSNVVAHVSEIRRALRGASLEELDLRENLLDAEEARDLAEVCRRRALSLTVHLAGNDIPEDVARAIGLLEDEVLQHVASPSQVVTFRDAAAPAEEIPSAKAVASGEARAADGAGRVAVFRPLARAPSDTAGKSMQGITSFEVVDGLRRMPRPDEFHGSLVRANVARMMAELGAAEEEEQRIDEKGLPPQRADAKEAVLAPPRRAGAQTTSQSADPVRRGVPAAADAKRSPAPTAAPAAEAAALSEPRPPLRLAANELPAGGVSSVSGEEWAECLDTLEWAKAMLAADEPDSAR